MEASRKTSWHSSRARGSNEAISELVRATAVERVVRVQEMPRHQLNPGSRLTPILKPHGCRHCGFLLASTPHAPAGIVMTRVADLV